MALGRESVVRAARGKLDALPIAGRVPLPNVSDALAVASELVRGVEGVGGAPKLAPSVGIFAGSVEARRVLWPTGLAPVETCIALGAEEAMTVVYWELFAPESVR